jgi:hypothetical protein
MKPEHADAMHDMVRAVDALEEALCLNDPEARAAAMDAAYRAGVQAFASLFQQPALERAAAAGVGREPTDPEGVGPEALRAAEQGVGEAIISSREGARGCRNMLARFILDHAALLPPGLAQQGVVGLHQLNLGKALPIFQPYRVQGLRGGAPKWTGQLALYGRIYYHMGYHDRSREEAIAEEVSAVRALEDADSVTGGQIRHFAKRTETRPVLDWCRERGKADRQAGKKFSPPLGADYSIEQLLELEKKARR